jgi:hypothetical protein
MDKIVTFRCKKNHLGEIGTDKKSSTDLPYIITDNFVGLRGAHFIIHSEFLRLRWFDFTHILTNLHRFWIVEEKLPKTSS